MSETLDYIENYFTNRLTPQDRQVFENRCLADKSFAEEVALYVSTRQHIRTLLDQQKKEEFTELYRRTGRVQQPSALVRILKPVISVAAACLLIVLAWNLFFRSPSPEKLADNYISEQFSSLGVKMGGDADSMQLGLAAYNKKEYSTAAGIFQRMPGNTDAIRYLGIVYLVTGQLNEALQQFDMLAQQKGLYANPAVFYKAVTLMKRSQPGDREKAKLLLEEVVKNDLSGSREAGEWLKHL